MTELGRKRVLIVGAGGLGCPAATVLARSGVGRIDVADDDVVDEGNLQRQTLYTMRDVGRPKAQLAADRLMREGAAAGHQVRAVAREMRVLPDNAVDAVSGYDLVLEGADNFASKFLLADACVLAHVPVVQAGAVRWVGWTMASRPGHSACLRCVFEDIPSGQADTCAAAGVIGPVVGVLASLQAALALRLLSGDTTAAGELISYRGLSGELRSRPLARQARCPLCAGSIQDIDVARYIPPDCAA